MPSDPYGKSMWRYVQHVRNDAMEIAAWIESRGHTEALRRAFVSDPVHVERGLADNSEIVSEFISRPWSRRDAYARQVGKESIDGSFLGLLAILTLQRVEAVLEARDRYAGAFAAGGGYRVTAAALGEFTSDIQDSFKVVWPEDLFGDGEASLASDD